MATDAHEFKLGFADNIANHTPRTPDQLRSDMSLTSTIGELAALQALTTGVKISKPSDPIVQSSDVYQMTGQIPRTTISALFDATNGGNGFRVHKG